MIIYLSSIVGISQDYYEAARIDGATKWKQITDITLPSFKTDGHHHADPVCRSYFLLLISVFLPDPEKSRALYNVTSIIDAYAYNALMKNADYDVFRSQCLPVHRWLPSVCRCGQCTGTANTVKKMLCSKREGKKNERIIQMESAGKCSHDPCCFGFAPLFC